MRAWKLQECVAHSPGGVTCLSLGRKSGRVLATGGDDRRVKLWAIGKPTCILSLTGHTSSIEATEFSQEEDRVAAGSLSGSIRIWDLEEVKIVRTLTGHTSGINSLDFHPFGNFISSGSSDTLVKLWDVSRKGCINTYRGHNGGVNMVRFSPDGKWVVSGGQDGVVKLWDLSAGRQLAELLGNNGPITAVAFHPTVLLLATASADHTVRLYDLENFTQVAVSGPELAAASIRRIAFHPDGVCLYVATTEHLKIYDYETMACLETVHVGWRTGGGLHDMAVAPSFNQLVGVSMSGCAVSTYVVDVKACVPFISDNLSSAINRPQQEQPVLQSRPTFQPSDRTAANAGDASAVVKNRRPAQRSRPQAGGPTSRDHKNRKSFCRDGTPNTIPQEDTTDPDSQQPYNPSLEEQNDPSNIAEITDINEYDRVFKPHRTVPRSPPRSANNKPGFSTEESSCPRPTGIINKPSSPCLKRNSEDEPFVPPSSSDRTVSVNPSEEDIPKSAAPISAANSVPPKDTSPKVVRNSKEDGHIEMLTSEPSESDWLSSLSKPHSPFMAVMSSRVKHLSTIQMMWSRDNMRTALETALVLNDPAVLVDILGVLAQNSKHWTLELVYILLPHLLPLMKSKYSRHVETTCQIVHLILKNFAQVIRQTVEGPTIPGVDLMREKRQIKCRECLQHLLSIRSALDSADVASRAGSCGKELLVLFQTLS